MLCDQYGYDPFAWLCIQWWCNITHAPIDALRGVSIHLWMIEACDTLHPIQGNNRKCASFHPSTHGTSFEYCVASIDVVPLLCCLWNGVSTTLMYPQIDQERCQNLDGWLEFKVHHTHTKARPRSGPVFLYPCWSNLGVLCGQYGYDPLVWSIVQLFININHAHIDELRGV